MSIKSRSKPKLHTPDPAPKPPTADEVQGALADILRGAMTRRKKLTFVADDSRLDIERPESRSLLRSLALTDQVIVSAATALGLVKPA